MVGYSDPGGDRGHMSVEIFQFPCVFLHPTPSQKHTKYSGETSDQESSQLMGYGYKDHNVQDFRILFLFVFNGSIPFKKKSKLLFLYSPLFNDLNLF